MVFQGSFACGLHGCSVGGLSKAALLMAVVLAWAFSSSAGAQGGLLEEIVVVAQKRTASAQDVPMAISAVSGQTARDLGWSNAEDIVAQIPNVSLDESAARSEPSFRVRGLGAEVLNSAGQSPVGVYVNEVYINNLQGRGIALFDLERVEVLRGPQGTLWGKNTTAGAIHFITRRPSHEADGYALASVGVLEDATQWTLEGAAGGSIIADTLAGRVAFKIEDSENWVNNEFPGGEDLGGFQTTAVRGSLLFTPNDFFDAHLALSYSDYDGQFSETHPLGGSLWGYQEREGIGFNVSQNTPGQDDFAEIFNMTLGANWVLGDWMLSSVTGFNSVDAGFFEDDDFSPADGIVFDRNTDVSQWSQEIRLASPEEQRFRWILGAYAFYEDLESSYNLNFSNVPLSIAPFSAADLFRHVPNPAGGDPAFVRAFPVFLFGPAAVPMPTGADSLVVRTQEKRDRNSYAVFGNFDMDIAEDWSLNVGLRYTSDEEEIDMQMLNFFISGFGHLDFATRNAEFGAPYLVVDVQDDEDWGELSGDVTLNWAINEDSIAYLKYSHGYRAGQYNITNTLAEDFSLVNPEFLDSYELGAKTSVLDGNMEINGAVYFYDYTDIIVNVFNPIAGAITLLNGDDASVVGAEVDFRYAPTASLYISGGLGYSKTKFLADAAAPPDQDPEFVKGNQFAQSPKWTANLLVQYSIPLSSGAFIRLQTDWRYRGKSHGEVSNAPPFALGDRKLGNAAVSYETADARWQVSLWVRNLLDDRYYTQKSAHPAALGARGYKGHPISYGLTVSADF